MHRTHPFGPALHAATQCMPPHLQSSIITTLTMGTAMCQSSMPQVPLPGQQLDSGAVGAANPGWHDVMSGRSEGPGNVGIQGDQCAVQRLC